MAQHIHCLYRLCEDGAADLASSQLVKSYGYGDYEPPQASELTSCTHRGGDLTSSPFHGLSWSNWIRAVSIPYSRDGGSLSLGPQSKRVSYRPGFRHPCLIGRENACRERENSPLLAICTQMYPIIMYITVIFITVNELELRWTFEFIRFACSHSAHGHYNSTKMCLLHNPSQHQAWLPHPSVKTHLSVVKCHANNPSCVAYPHTVYLSEP